AREIKPGLVCFGGVNPSDPRTKGITFLQIPSVALRDRASSSATPRASPVAARPHPSPIRRNTLPLFAERKKRRENLRSRMSKPKRIQRSRAKGWKMPANAIYVGRPTVWGNPYVAGSELMNGETLTAEKAVELYEKHLADNFSEGDIRHCLHDKDLACWCALDQPCHADVLLRIANSRPK